ncbi:phosphotransferase family protein [Streptomyces sp. NPDC102406]|uniref:phosphotransferase family protein n=1 Tax=Streptomyces sp. NPDC102406 TaxID=3366171 RepID=UPI00382A264D
MSSPLRRRARQALVRKLAEGRRRARQGEITAGYHNQNLIAPLGFPLAVLLGVGGRVFGVSGKFRTPVETVEVVPRLWRRESEVLRALDGSLTQVPRCLADFGEWSLHSYLVGDPLSVVRPSGPVGEERLRALADFFARLASVPVHALPELPESYWPEPGSSRQFLGWLAKFADDKVHRVNEKTFGALFHAVGIPGDAIEKFMCRLPDDPRDGLTHRPFAVLHTDVHRGNVVVARAPGGREQLCVIDFELACYGDPLHELATHLVRMEYDDAERRAMTDFWAEAMCKAGHEPMTRGMETDLSWYLDFEHVQSVFPDVMRAALSLGDAPTEDDVDQAARRVCRAMERAWKPLGLDGESPDLATGRAALYAWHADRGIQPSADV